MSCLDIELLKTQRALQSMLRMSLFAVRKHRYIFEAQYMIVHISSHLPHLSLLPDFVFIGKKTAGRSQNAFSNCILCTTW